jgi:2-methylaconitate cis-trans-isomerase PrpF
MTTTAKDLALWPGARRRGDQVGIRCVFMRGGTSRGAILRVEDLPSDPALRERLILAIYGSPDIRQIDGLGGADPLTSKVAIVGPSTRPDADVDFTFGQVRIGEPHVDFSGNCGNISAAIAPFAIDEGLVPATEPTTSVRIHLVNTDAVITSEATVLDGLAAAEGDTEVPGVPGAGARVTLDFGEGSSTLGMGVLPTGVARETVETPYGPHEVSIVDAGNPTVFVRASDVGLRGTELPDAFTPALLDRLSAIRGAGAVAVGLADEASTAAATTPAVPKLYVVSPAADYVDLAGRPVSARDVSVVGRGLSMGVPHQAYAGTVAICTGVAAAIPGTLVDELVPGFTGGRFRIGHPSGVMGVDVGVALADGRPVVTRAAIERTARRIMDGTVWVPVSRLLG